MRVLKTLLCFAIATAAAGSVAAQPLVLTFERIFDADSLGFGGDSFDNPSVDDSGNVAAEISEDIYAMVDGQLRGIAVVGETGYPEDDTILLELTDDHVEISNGRVAFEGRFALERGGTEDVLMLGDGIDLVAILAENFTEVPGEPKGTIFTGFGIGEGFGTDGTRVALEGRWPDMDRGTTLWGLFLWDGSELTQIVRRDDASVGFFRNFDNAMPDANGSAIVFVVDRDLGERGVSFEELYLYDGGELNLLLSEGDPMVGRGVSIDFIGEPDIDGGRVVVSVGGPGGERAIYLIENGEITVVVEDTTALPGIDGSFEISTAGWAGIGGYTVGFGVSHDNGDSDTIFLWRDGSLQRVLGTGDVLDGSVVTGFTETNRPFMANGYMALSPTLEDPLRGRALGTVYRVAFRPESVLEVPTPAVSIALLLALALAGVVTIRRLA